MIYESQLNTQLSEQLKNIIEANKFDNTVEGVTEEEIKMAQMEQTKKQLVPQSDYYPRILEYLNTHGKAKAIDIKKDLKIDAYATLIYDVLRGLINRKLIVKHKFFYYPATSRGRVDLKKVTGAKGKIKLKKKATPEVADNRMPLLNERKQTPVAYTPQHRLVTILQKELKYIDDGIDSLRITRSYLLRRLEQVQADADAAQV